MIRKARACVAKYADPGSIYFACTAGDDAWWEAVPTENRSQVIQQAAVLKLDHVLFCVATTTSLVMCCLVHVTAEQRGAHEAAIGKWSHLMNWAHESLETTGPPPVPHEAFSPRDAYILSTHLRLWRALRKKVASNGCPIHPVYIVKCAAQHMCRGYTTIKCDVCTVSLCEDPCWRRFHTNKSLVSHKKKTE